MTAQRLSLRPYQREAIDAATAAWAEGIRRPAVVLATGLGKSFIFAQMASEYIERTGKRVLILAHRDELVSQAMEEVSGVDPNLSVGRVRAEDNDVKHEVVVASVQTLSRPRRLAQLLEHSSYGDARDIGLVITDECFPAGTTVGGTPIESLKSGDFVPTWNPDTGREEFRPVVATMRKRPLSLVQVALADGSSFVCTPNHPILTNWGWCPAGGLWHGAPVVSFTHDANASGSPLHGVHSARKPDHESPDRRVPEEWANVLFDGLPGRMGIPERFGADVPDEPETRFGTDAGTQPYAVCGDPGEGIRHAPGDRSQAPVPGREWQAIAGAPSSAGRIPGLANGSVDHSARRGAAVSLQGGYRSPDDEGVRGSGRGVPLLTGPPSLRPSEGRKAVRTRVVGVQVLEPGRDGTYGGMCPDGFVYNIEVDTTHTYLIGSGTVVHNCHHGVAPSYVRIYEALPDAVHLGVTATLARGDGIGLGSVWEDVVSEKSIAWGIKNGYLSPVRGIAVRTPELDLSRVKKSRGDYRVNELGHALSDSGVLDAIPKAYLEYAANRPGVAFLPTVETAEYTAEALRNAGITSAVISGETPREERARIFEDHRTGRVQVLSNCMVLTEGWNGPHTSCIVVARPTRSNPLYVQMVGRGTRTYPGKTDCLVLDIVGAGRDNKLRTLVDLEPGMFPEAVPCEVCDRTPCVCPCAGCGGPRPCSACNEREALELETGKTEEVDLFAGSTQSWLVTKRGVLFIPAGEAGEILLWQSQTPGHWDVVHAPKTGKWLRLHEALPLGTAQAWAESEADELAGFNVRKTAAWRKKKPSEAQVNFASQLRIDLPPDVRSGELGNLISVALASRKLDRYLPSV